MARVVGLRGTILSQQGQKFHLEGSYLVTSEEKDGYMRSIMFESPEQAIHCVVFFIGARSNNCRRVIVMQKTTWGLQEWDLWRKDGLQDVTVEIWENGVHLITIR